MTAPIIRVHDVWKSYRAAYQFQLKGRLIGKKEARPDSPKWALQGVDFEVDRGQGFGIVGHNGSGKTTLLSMLLGAITPTRGTIEAPTRMASLLELGSGFHPELTGRENIYLYASILGMLVSEVDECFESIVDFAELWDVIDSPLRVYSSGMNARLGFSTIIHAPVEVLLVDEILGVGDEHFKEKCADFFKGFRERGGTLVTVSHALAAIVELCDRGLYLRRGVPVQVGPMQEVVETYQREVREGKALRE